jgi:hypothetical protein
MQHKKCPSFNAMQTLFGQSPSCKPVDPKEIGGMEPESGNDGDTVEDDGDGPQEYESAAIGVAVVPAPTPPVKPAAVSTGKPAAPFHLTPSKNKVRHRHR